MKLYTFLDKDGNTIEEVRAEDHDKAVDKANAWVSATDDKPTVRASTDFYSTELSKDE